MSVIITPYSYSLKIFDYRDTSQNNRFSERKKGRRIVLEHIRLNKLVNLHVAFPCSEVRVTT